MNCEDIQLNVSYKLPTGSKFTVTSITNFVVSGYLNDNNDLEYFYSCNMLTIEWNSPWDVPNPKIIPKSKTFLFYGDL